MGESLQTSRVNIFKVTGSSHLHTGSYRCAPLQFAPICLFNQYKADCQYPLANVQLDSLFVSGCVVRFAVCVPVPRRAVS